MEEKEVWEQVLKLWKRMSEIPDCKVYEYQSKFKARILSEFKARILKELEMPPMPSSCPFCNEYYYDDGITSNSCHGCPINYGDSDTYCLYHTPYSQWSEHMSNSNEHSQRLAKNFYDWLKEKYAEKFEVLDD